MKQVASPWISEELLMLEHQVARFIAKEFSPRMEQWERDRQVDRESWCKAAEAGLLCASISEQYGGGGGTSAHEAVILQELVRAGLGGSFGIGHSIHSAIVAPYIEAYGTEAQKRRWLVPMARAERIGAIAMTEPGTGSDLKGIRTTAKRFGDGYRLNGQKTFISNGQTANLILVVARTEVDENVGGLSLVVVETEKAEGFRRGRNLQKLGLHGQDTSELFFDDVFVPAANLLGRAGDGFAQLKHQLAWERMVIALTALVNMECAIVLTTDYVLARSVFGKPLLELQNTQFVLADAKTQASVGRRFFDALMVQLLAGDLDEATAAMAKLWLTETAFKVIDACQQLFGGYGYVAEYPIARLFADVRASRVYGGASEIMKLIIARSL